MTYDDLFLFLNILTVLFLITLIKKLVTGIDLLRVQLHAIVVLLKEVKEHTEMVDRCITDDNNKRKLSIRTGHWND